MSKDNRKMIIVINEDNDEGFTQEESELYHHGAEPLYCVVTEDGEELYETMPESIERCIPEEEVEALIREHPSAERCLKGNPKGKKYGEAWHSYRSDQSTYYDGKPLHVEEHARRSMLISAMADQKEREGRKTCNRTPLIRELARKAGLPYEEEE